jgi:hypothetical protein
MRHRLDSDTGSETSKEAKLQLLIQATMRRAEEARNDISKFYEFVIREEKTRAKIQTTPHQHVMFSFAEYHPYCVIRIPVGCGKTYFIGARALFLLGKNRTRRGAIMASAQGQAKKVLLFVSDYIEDPTLNQPLALVFPELRPTTKAKEPWTSEAITVDRPAGIRDPSLVAAGLDTKISGSRLSYGVGDDIVDDINSRNPSVRRETTRMFNARLMNRMDPADSSVTVTNTPFDREDLTYYLENEERWPTITMDIYGYIRFSNAEASWMAMAMDTMLRPSTTRTGGAHDWYRLRAHDPDPEEETPLWPERYSLKWIQEKRYGKDGKGGMLPIEFARAFLCDPMSDDATRCQRAWIERCKLKGMREDFGFPLEYNGPNPTFTGVDLGVGKDRAHDRSTLFTFELLPSSERRILDIESGRWPGKTIIQKIIHKTECFDSSIAVENNNAQDYIIQFAVEEKKDLQITAHTTGKVNKHDTNWGVESIFNEVHNGAWIIPCDRNGKCHPEVQKWIDDMVFYIPNTHTGDHLMACWIGREASRKKKSSGPKPTTGKKRQMSSTGAF